MRQDDLAGKATRPRQFGRRRFVLGAGMLGASLLSGGGFATQGATMAQSAPGPVDPEAGSWTSPTQGLEVTWDTALWQVWIEPSPGRDFIGLCNADANPRDAFEDIYYLGVEYLEKPWLGVDGATASAQADWFSQGMLGATVIQEWTAPDAYGWFHISDFQGARSFNYLEYSPAPTSGWWREVAFSIDGSVFDEQRALALYQAATVDGLSVPRAVDLQALVALMAQHLLA